MSDLIVGIDLGTTNSEVAAFVDGQVRVLGPADQRILPSCVGFSASGELLVGEPARNQQALYPERTVRSIKRRMGSPETVMLGGRSFTPPEISALILRELAEWARASLGELPQKAVITVPAYFSDAQRSATREAGALAGLEVVRILNEPTAASLAYGYGDGSRHTALIYDLGGGTFDVSVVTVEGDITEVLASHGNNRLGGDDFDDLLAERLVEEFQKQHGIDLRKGHPAAKARLWWAAEEAKKKLSLEPYVTIREEALIERSGKPLHLEMEISRHEYEEMIRPLVESTLDSVSKALQDSRQRAGRHGCGSAGWRIDPHAAGVQSARRADRGRTAPGCASGPVRGAGRRRAGVALWRGATWIACWWMSRLIPSASRFWGSAAAFPIRTATSRSSGATRRCR